MHMSFFWLDPPKRLYSPLSQALPFHLICHTLIKNRGLSINPWPFLRFWRWKHHKTHCSHVQFILLDIILARWQHPVVSSEALDFFHQAICAVTYQRIAIAIKMACFLGVFVDCCLFACCPGGCWGNTEQVVARCQCPVAFGVALDMPHWAMPSVLLRRTAMAIKTTGGWVHLFATTTFFYCCNHSLRPCYYQLKKQQARLLFVNMLLTILYLIGRRRQQWTPFWPPLLPADKPD